MNNTMIILIIFSIFFSLFLVLFFHLQQKRVVKQLDEKIREMQAFAQNATQTQTQDIQQQQATLSSHLRQEITHQLSGQKQELHQQLTGMHGITEQKLNQFYSNIDQHIAKSFEKSHQTFQSIIARLAKIDEAQKHMDHLAKDIHSLSAILNDKRSRGAFGEQQLSMIIQNAFPMQQAQFQTTLSNGKRPDCLLTLPHPTGNIAIDAKFPLENYRRIYQEDGKKDMQASKQFAQDVKKHIQDIAQKYICPPETGHGAIMFVPAENIFYEIYAYHEDLVSLAQHLNVWIASPTTLVAILTTASAVIKDDQTRAQAHWIQEQIYLLEQEFKKFNTQMEKLARHIDQAQQDTQNITKSSQKISKRFFEICEHQKTED